MESSNSFSKQINSPNKVQKPKRQRNRVPVSCLACKKRKVKCDKGKPACGGCVRNGVGHLCQYINPPWIDNDASGGGSSPLASCQSLLSPVKIETTSEYKQLKSQNEKTISNQKKEIENLKRQLQVLQQLSPRNSQSANSESRDESTFYLGKDITILSKLSPFAVQPRVTMEILSEYTVLNSRVLSFPVCLDIYSWVNIIKLDPQLTTLWFKITNLQKMYHMYKINKLKNDNSAKKLAPSQLKKTSSKINEIDFTYSFLPSDSQNTEQQSLPLASSTSNNHKCPVIECDFNFMGDEAQSQTPSPKRNVTNSTLTSTTQTQDDSEKLQCPVFKPDIHNKSKSLQQKLQSLWESILNLTRGSTLNYRQLVFLLDFYFKSEIFESKTLLLFYKTDILNVIQKGLDGELILNLPKGLDEDIYYQLKISGIYVSMIAVIVEETLTYLRNVLKCEVVDDITQSFNVIFPQEYTYLGLGAKQTNILYIIEDFLTSDDDNINLVSFVALYITVLNKIIYEYKKPGGLVIDPKTLFTKLFSKFIENILSSGSDMEIWKDPELIEFQSYQRKRAKYLKLHFSLLWTEVIRICNLVSFNFVPIIKQSSELDHLLQKMYSKIAIVDLLQCHLKYLTRVGESNLIIALHVHYLIASITSSFHYGILNIGIPKLTVSNLDSLIKQCSTWLQDSGLEEIIEIKRMEVVYMLSYLRLFMIYILLLQGEELNEEGLLETFVFPGIVSRLSQFVEILKNGNHQSQYIYLALIELFTRSIQMAIGLLLRVKNQSGFLKLHQSLLEDQINKITNDVSSTLKFLQTVIVNNKEKLVKLSKLWKFYLTFVNNSNSKQVNYAALHKGVPEFSQPKSCPVIHDSTTKSTSMANSSSSVSIKSEGAKCPISHITTLMNENEESTKLQEVGSNVILPPIVSYGNGENGASSNGLSLSNQKRRKCPFDHTAMMKRKSVYNNPIESNMREYRSYTPSPLGSSMPITTPMMRHQQEDEEMLKPVPLCSPPSNHQQIDSAASTTSSPSMFVLDDLDVFNEFNDFDLDFLHNEHLLNHIENNNNNNNNSVAVKNSADNNESRNIENYFQG